MEMFSRTYGYMLRHPATRRGYWGNWYYRRRYQRVLERLAVFCRNKETTLLEFGCGLGFYAKYLEEAGLECSYVGCDIDNTSLMSAYRSRDSDYVKCDAQQPPFRKKCVDVVLCSEVLEHLQFPYKTLEDIIGITRDSFVLTFPEELLLTTFRDSHPEHVSAIDASRVRQLLVSKGFKIVQVSHIFSSFFPCGVLEFLHVPRNSFIQAVIEFVDRLLGKIVPSALVPHKTFLVEAILRKVIL